MSLKKSKVITFHVDKYKFTITFTKWCHFTDAEILFEVELDSKKTSFLCNVVVNQNENEDSFVNLNVNYKEPSYVIGKISSGKRDKQSERETLISRGIDKIIRPLLNEVTDKIITVNLMMLNYAENIDLASIASLAAIFCLKTKYQIDSACIKLAIFDKDLIELFPGSVSSQESLGNITIGANKDRIFYLDAELKNFSTSKIEKHIKKALDFCAIFSKELATIPSKEEIIGCFVDFELIKKQKITENFKGLELSQKLGVQYESLRKTVSAYLAKKQERLQNRGMEELRSIKIEHGPIEKCHNVIFTRGQTVVLGSVNLCKDKLNIGETIRDEKNIMPIYIFPGFSTGSSFDKKSTRRETGHADLIRASFQKITPPNLAIRIYAEVLSADGSSSMASVCAVSAAGVKMGIFQDIVSGISVGIFRDNKKEVYPVDITAMEDQYSEADVKITGSKDGLTAIRADTKSFIIAKNIGKILQSGQKAIKDIVEKIEKSGFKNENEIIVMEVDQKKLGLLIGTNGKNIKELSEKTSCRIKTQQDGKVCIIGQNSKLAELFLKAFKTEDQLKKNEVIAFIIKENSDGQICQTNVGEIMLEINHICKKGDTLQCKIKNWRERRVEVL